LYDLKGNISGILGTYMDITELKQMEDRNTALVEQIHHQQRLETVGQLAAGIAHDFNNILTGITGFTQFALGSLPAAGATHDDLTEVLTLAKRAAELTQQLLAFSRRQPLQPVVLNINDVVSNMAKMLGRLLGEHIKIKFELADDLGAIRVDPGQFEQVLMNLAVNARDAMPDGGILTIGTANAELDEEYSSTHIGTKPGSYVMLTVADSGCGMSAELLDHIFEPFFTTKGVGKGTGLGLATVYGIVKQHGGNIWVYSEPDHGTIFRTYFPRVNDEISAVAITESSNTCTGTETILIVEDDPAVLKVTQGILTAFGYQVLSAALPSQAESVLAEHGDTIALMLTDIMMPERNGHQLFESVHARFPRMRVLYMSGYPADVIGNQGVLDSRTGFISKPFTANALGQKVRDILDAKK
ncbi:MAG: ATP-binding protein, partial [bacterium]